MQSPTDASVAYLPTISIGDSITTLLPKKNDDIDFSFSHECPSMCSFSGNYNRIKKMKMFNAKNLSVCLRHSFQIIMINVSLPQLVVIRIIFKIFQFIQSLLSFNSIQYEAFETSRVASLKYCLLNIEASWLVMWRHIIWMNKKKKKSEAE